MGAGEGFRAPGANYFSFPKSKELRRDRSAAEISSEVRMRLEFVVLFLVLPLVTGGSAQSKSAQTKSAQKTEIDIPYERFVLDNGLTVIVHEDHKAPIVAINTWYHVGSKNEKPGKTGFAHLFEHLMFSGSDNFNHTYINAMERIGATTLNGTTNNDRTNYFENV